MKFFASTMVTKMLRLSAEKFFKSCCVVTSCSILLLPILLCDSIASAQDLGAATGCEPLVFAEVSIACFSETTGSFSPADRVRAAEIRLKTLAQEKLFDVSSIAIEKFKSSSLFKANGQIILTLQPNDREKSDVDSSSQFDENVLQRIKLAIEQERKNQSPKLFLHSIIYAGALSLLLIVLLVSISIIFYKTTKWLSLIGNDRFPTFKFQQYELINKDRVRAFVIWILNFLKIVLSLSILYLFIPIILSLFPQTSSLASKLYSYILNPISLLFQKAVAFTPDLIFLIVLFVGVRYFLRFLKLIFLEIENGNLRFEGFYREWADPTFKLVRVGVIAFALVVAFPYIPGSNSPAFKGLSVFLGILVSLGSSSAIANVVAGVVITYMRPFKIGDRVQIAESTGDVIEKSLLVTKIMTIKNVVVTIPNSQILGTQILNFTSEADSRGIILHTTVTIGYDAAWLTIHTLLQEAALSTTDIESSPEPFVLQTSLDDFYVSYQLNAFTRRPDCMAKIYSELHQNIQDQFNRAGVEIMSPHYASLREGNDLAMPEGASKPSASTKFKIQTFPS